MVRITVLMLTVLFVMLPLSGCLSNEDNDDVEGDNADLMFSSDIIIPLPSCLKLDIV